MPTVSATGAGPRHNLPQLPNAATHSVADRFGAALASMLFQVAPQEQGSDAPSVTHSLSRPGDGGMPGDKGLAHPAADSADRRDGAPSNPPIQPLPMAHGPLTLPGTAIGDSAPGADRRSETSDQTSVDPRTGQDEATLPAMLVSSPVPTDAARGRQPVPDTAISTARELSPNAPAPVLRYAIRPSGTAVSAPPATFQGNEGAVTAVEPAISTLHTSPAEKESSVERLATPQSAQVGSAVDQRGPAQQADPVPKTSSVGSSWPLPGADPAPRQGSRASSEVMAEASQRDGARFIPFEPPAMLQLATTKASTEPAYQLRRGAATQLWQNNEQPRGLSEPAGSSFLGWSGPREVRKETTATSLSSRSQAGPGMGESSPGKARFPGPDGELLSPTSPGRSRPAPALQTDGAKSGESAGLPNFFF